MSARSCVDLGLAGLCGRRVGAAPSWLSALTMCCGWVRSILSP